jgi:serine/threonine protein kinase
MLKIDVGACNRGTQKAPPRPIQVIRVGSPPPASEAVGSGAFARIFVLRWQHGSHKKIFALKVSKDTPEAEAQLENEKTCLQTLGHHKNIVAIRYVARLQADRVPGLVLEYAHDGELFDLLKNDGKMDADSARALFAQLVDGLLHCHGKGIYHRDIKPENLLLTDNASRLLIADFGEATDCLMNTFSDTLVGTPTYSAPEMQTPGVYRRDCADVWACGAVLYTMLTASMFDASDAITAQGSIGDLLRAILQPEPQRRCLLKDIPAYAAMSKAKSLCRATNATGQRVEFVSARYGGRSRACACQSPWPSNEQPETEGVGTPRR